MDDCTTKQLEIDKKWVFSIFFAILTLKWPWCDLDMTLVLSTSKAQLLLMLLFAHKLRSCWCLQTDRTLQNILFFYPPSPLPGIQRWGCKCAQEFSVKMVNASSSSFTASLPPFSTTSPLISDSLLPFNAPLSSFNVCTSLFNAPVALKWFCHACYASVSTLTPLHCNCRLSRRSLMPLGQSWIPLCRHLITPHCYLTHLHLLVSFCCLSIAM